MTEKKYLPSIYDRVKNPSPPKTESKLFPGEEKRRRRILELERRLEEARSESEKYRKRLRALEQENQRLMEKMKRRG